jgi:hypothetical protein
MVQAPEELVEHSNALLEIIMADNLLATGCSHEV